MERVVFLPSFDAVLAYRQSQADAASRASFGELATTFPSWFADLWLLHGDGRALAGHDARLMAFMRILKDCPQGAFPASLGLASLLVRLVDGGLGLPQFDAALAQRSCLDAPSDLLDIVVLYERLLEQRGLVDPGRACGLLAAARIPGAPSTLRAQGVELSEVQKLLVASLSWADFKHDASFGAPIQPRDGIQVRFAFPAGRYAEPLLLVDAVKEHAVHGGVVLASPHPAALYESMAPQLADEGFACVLRDRVPFKQTDFGQAFVSIYRVLTEPVLRKLDASDFAFSSFSGMSVSKAYEFDAWLRGNRLLSAGECIARLRTSSPYFEYFEELVATPEADVVLGFFEENLSNASHGNTGWMREQASAISALRSLMLNARLFGLPMDTLVALLDDAVCDASRSCGTGECTVSFVGLSRAAGMRPGSCGTLIACGTTSAEQPLRDRDDSATSLLARLGIEARMPALATARNRFSGMLAVPSHTFIIERCLNDENADPTYPCAAVEEFVDCYRPTPEDISDIDNRYSLPEQLQKGLIERGEELLYENAAVAHGPQEVRVVVPQPDMGRISVPERPRIMLPRRAKGGGTLPYLCFSASQIEAYLECPQKWFALRRMHLEDLEEGFGAVQMGDFSHRALEQFYLRFQERYGPHAKVSPDTMDEARALMADVLKEARVQQMRMKPTDNRLVPTSVLEAQQVEELCGRLMNYLDREAQLLPGFHPWKLEYAIKPAEAIDYAGHKLVGSVDRIDADEAGRLVVIDYKSSISNEYDLYESTNEGAAFRQGKVQALIYAQALRRALGRPVVGALYVAYGRTYGVSGAYDGQELSDQSIPGIHAGRCKLRAGDQVSFEDVLDQTEERVACALDRLLAGDVAPNPATARACEWCPVASCAKRRG